MPEKQRSDFVFWFYWEMENLSQSQVSETEILGASQSISIMTNYFINNNNNKIIKPPQPTVACIWHLKNVNTLIISTLNIKTGKYLVVTELNLFFLLLLNLSLPLTRILNWIIHLHIKYIEHPPCLCGYFEGMYRCKNVCQSRELLVRTYFLIVVFWICSPKPQRVIIILPFTHSALL